MGRLTAIALLVAIGFPLISPVLLAGSEPTLPACCRRDGKHHCAMPGAAGGHHKAPGAVLKISPKCPVFPSTSAAPTVARVSAPMPAPMTFAPSLGRPAAVEQAEARYRVSFSRAWHKRGPPSSLHS